MLGFFKKKKGPGYDVTNLSLRDLDFGFIVDYDDKSWIVKEVYEYDWGNHNFSKEYRIDSGDQSGYLNISEEDGLFITLSNPIKLHKIEEDIMGEIKKKQKPPQKIHYNEETFYMNEDSAGYFRDCGKKTKDWEEFICWDYFNDQENQIISITQWDEFNMEAHAGEVLKEHQFSNIIPG